MQNSFIIHKGASFTVEWYKDERGGSQAKEYYDSLDVKEKTKFLRLVKLLGEFGFIKDTTKFNNEGSQIYTFKPQPYRFLCFFFDGKKVIVTNAFCKKQQKLPIGERDKAIKMRENYEQRVKTGKYYES